MTKVQTYNAKGEKAGEFEFPKELLAKANLEFLAQALHVYEDRLHKGTSKVKTRSEVNATTAKMYKQKGTGNARHGDRKAPIFKGGGIAHGPKGIKRWIKLSKGLKKAALKMAMQIKTKENAIVLVEKLASIEKTKDAANLIRSALANVKKTGLKNITLAVAAENTAIIKAFRNIAGIKIANWNNLNAWNTFHSNLLLIDKEVFNEGKSVKSGESTKSIKGKEKPAKKVKKVAEKKKTVVKKTTAKKK